MRGAKLDFMTVNHECTGTPAAHEQRQSSATQHVTRLEAARQRLPSILHPLEPPTK